jgi:hypothetical protein
VCPNTWHRKSWWIPTWRYWWHKYGVLVERSLLTKQIVINFMPNFQNGGSRHAFCKNWCLVIGFLINCNFVSSGWHAYGIAKAGEYQPGDTDDTNMGCLWNAVYVQNKWSIVHPFWSCRAVFGKVSGGWIKLEAGGK